MVFSFLDRYFSIRVLTEDISKYAPVESERSELQYRLSVCVTVHLQQIKRGPICLLGHPQAEIDFGESTSKVHVSAMSPATDSNLVASLSQSTVALPQAPGIAITKVLSGKTTNLGLDQTIVDAGDNLIYTLSIENVGNTWLSALTVVHPYLGGIICRPDLSASDARFVVGAAPVVCTGSISVDQAMVNAGFFESQSSVSAQPCGRMSLRYVQYGVVHE